MTNNTAKRIDRPTKKNIRIRDILMVIDINKYDYIISRRMIEEFDNE